MCVTGLVFGIGLPTCGPFDEGEEDRVADVIERGFIEPRPENCSELATQRFLDQLSPREGARALDDCREDAEDEDSFAESVDVTEVNVDGDKAAATAEITGGNSDGQRMVLSLVKDRDQWKIDYLEELDIDRERFDKAALGDLTEPRAAFSKRQARCVISEIHRNVSDSELERAFIASNYQPISRAFIECLGNGDPRAAFDNVLRTGLIRAGLTNAQTNCILREVRDDVNRLDANDFLTGRTPPGIQAALTLASSKCVLEGQQIPKPKPEGNA
jgi:hypothetical protein